MTEDEESELTSVRQAPAQRRARPRRGVAAARSRDARGQRVRVGRGPRHAPPQVAMAEMTYIQAISDALRLEMRRDPRVFILGEDVGVYGGAFKVSLGFQEEFGPWRVIDTPLSETAIVGGATGAALMGLRPVAEMQFADFISCAWDHLVTVAAKQFFRARRQCRSSSGCRRAAGSRAGRSTRRTRRRPSRTSPGSRSCARRRRTTRRASSRCRSRTRTPSCSSSTSTSIAGSRATCRTTGTPCRSVRRASTARATTPRS